MWRTVRIALVVMMLFVVTVGCSAGGGDDEQREIIDPQGTEFIQQRATARARMVEVERTLRTSTGASRVVGVREQVGCVLGDKGPKGSDEWDSECDLRRSLGIFAADPVGAMLKIDGALVKLGYRGVWYGADGRTEVNPAEVRSGKISRGAVKSASYQNGSGLAITLQAGRTGERQLFLSTSPRSGYFSQSEGEDWESVVPRGTTIKEPLVAAELRIPHFIRRPITA